MVSEIPTGSPLQVPTEERLLADIESFCEAYGVAITTLGREAVGDTGFVARLRKGRSPSISVVRRVYRYIGEVVRAEAEKAKSDNG